MKNGLLAGILLLIFFACKNDKVEENSPTTSTVTLNVIPTWDGQSITSLDTITTLEGYSVQFLTIKFFIGNLTNNNQLVLESALYDWSNGTTLFSGEADPANFTNLNGIIGVDAAINHNDPSAFPNDSPLNIMNANDMHWDWNPGYIFVKIEAKADTIPDQTVDLNHTLIYHLGLDVNARDLSIDGLTFSSVGNNNIADLNLDLNAFLTTNPIDIKSEYTSHSSAGQEALTSKLMDNFKAALKKF